MSQEDAYAAAIVFALNGSLVVAANRVSIELVGFDVFVTIRVPTESQATVVKETVEIFPCELNGCFWQRLQGRFDNAVISKTGGEPSIVEVGFEPPSAPPQGTGTLATMEARQEVADSGGVGTGVVVGIVIGCVCFLVLIGAAIAAYVRGLKRRFDKAEQVMLNALSEGPGPVPSPSKKAPQQVVSVSDC